MALENKSCCRLETGALVYGILNAIVNAVATIYFFGLLVYVVIGITDINRDKPILRERSQNLMAVELFYLLIVTPVALIAFIFSILLIIGVTKKKPDLVLTYFIFGILWTSVSIVVASAYQAGTIDFIIAGVSSALILIYALPLMVVYKTFKKLRSEAILDLQPK